MILRLLYFATFSSYESICSTFPIISSSYFQFLSISSPKNLILLQNKSDILHRKVATSLSRLAHSNLSLLVCPEMNWSAIAIDSLIIKTHPSHLYHHLPEQHPDRPHFPKILDLKYRATQCYRALP